MIDDRKPLLDGRHQAQCGCEQLLGGLHQCCVVENRCWLAGVKYCVIRSIDEGESVIAYEAILGASHHDD